MSNKRIFTVLENNPNTVNQLAHALGLSDKFAFHDVYSLTDPDLLALVPRPVHALLAIIPMTPSWNQSRRIDDDKSGPYTASGPDEPVLWFRQTITHGCGSIGMLHCTLNGGPSPEPGMIVSGSHLANLRKDATPLKTEERAELVAKSDELYDAHEAVARLGDTKPPTVAEADRLYQHFVAFVKGTDGHLYELEGNRKGPLDRGELGSDDDMLSTTAIELGLGRLIAQEKAAGGDLRFSCIALGPATGQGS